MPGLEIFGSPLDKGNLKTNLFEPYLDTATHGNWVGTYGSVGYVLAAFLNNTGQPPAVNSQNQQPVTDLIALPSGITLDTTNPNRDGAAGPAYYQWSVADVISLEPKELEDPLKTYCNACTWYNGSNHFAVGLTFADGFTGSLAIYAMDFDPASRREMITVQSNALDTGAGGFANGIYAVFPISAAPGEWVPVVVDLIGGANPVVGGLFLDGLSPVVDQGNFFAFM